MRKLIRSKQEIKSELRSWDVATLVKFFSEVRYAQAFIEDGCIHMQAIGAFAKTEQGRGRADIYEGQASRIMRVNYDHAIYCMMSLSSDNLEMFLETPDGNRVVREFAGENGVCCVIRDPTEFLLRFQNREPSAIRFGLVSYDGDLFENREAFNHIDDVPFTKGRRFQYQHEFRVIASHACKEHFHYENLPGLPHEKVYEGTFEPYDIALGSLADIATLQLLP